MYAIFIESIGPDGRKVEVDYDTRVETKPRARTPIVQRMLIERHPAGRVVSAKFGVVRMSDGGVTISAWYGRVA
jgi:hypothetical protein